MFLLSLDLHTAEIIRKSYFYSFELRTLIVGSYDVFSGLITPAILEILTAVIYNTIL